MNQNYKIRKAVMADLEPIFKFISHLEERTFDLASFTGRFKENIEKPDILYLVAVNEEDVAIGFVSCHGQSPLRYEGMSFEIQEMYISKSCRGKGIEGLLFASLEERLGKMKCERVEISSVIDRLDAKKFYLKLGFNSMLARYVKEY
jgi:ribosomal protein S18 acetylase RimI-like enzyme